MIRMHARSVVSDSLRPQPGSSVHGISWARILEWVATYMQLKKWAKTNLSFSDAFAEELMLLNCSVGEDS